MLACSTVPTVANNTIMAAVSVTISTVTVDDEPNAVVDPDIDVGKCVSSTAHPPSSPVHEVKFAF